MLMKKQQQRFTKIINNTCIHQNTLPQIQVYKTTNEKKKTENTLKVYKT